MGDTVGPARALLYRLGAAGSFILSFLGVTVFHILGYGVTGAGANDTNVDMTARVDPTFTRRNSHYIFTEQFNLLAAYNQQASALRCRFNVPTWNAWCRQQIQPVMRSATIPTPVWLADYRDLPLAIPQNEEIALEESADAAAGGDLVTSFLWIAPPGWSRDIPQTGRRMMARFTASPTGVANDWSTDAAITFDENLRGGVYQVNGVHAGAANLLAFRVNFVRAMSYQGRKLFPGDLGLQAVSGRIPNQKGVNWLGTWGKFHSFELPQMAVFAAAAGAMSVVGYMDLSYLGETAAGF